MGNYKTVADYDKALQRLARQRPDLIAKGTDAFIKQTMVKHARARHPKRGMSRKEARLIMFKSIAMRKAGRKPKPGPKGRRFRSWGGGGAIVGSISGKAALRGKYTTIGWLTAASAHASYVEFGTSTAAPHPFLKPAITENWGGLKNMLRLGAKQWSDSIMR